MRLFVGNLSWSVTAKELRDTFSEFGEVEDARIIKERSSGRSRGFGFVTFCDAEGGNRALESLNGTEFFGRELKLDRAQEISRD